MYVIASHTLPDQVLRLASLLRGASPSASLALHHDGRRSRIDHAAAQRLGIKFVEPPIAVQWGEASHLDMVLRCLQFCLEGIEFEWLVMLSGQDYPIRPIAEIEHGLGDVKCDALVEAQQCLPPGLHAPVDEFSARYYFRWRRARYGSLVSLARVAARSGAFVRTRRMPSGDWIGVRALRTPFGPKLVCHRGSDWFSLSRIAVESVDAFARRRPDVLRYYRRTLHPNESFIQTALANEGSLRISGDIRRYSVWNASPHQTGPDVLRMSDLETLLGSGSDFARKFDQTTDSDVLDAIDRRVHSL